MSLLPLEQTTYVMISYKLVVTTAVNEKADKVAPHNCSSIRYSDAGVSSFIMTFLVFW